jgi:hypothetical protein
LGGQPAFDAVELRFPAVTILTSLKCHLSNF